MIQPDEPHNGLELGEASPVDATALRWMTRVLVGVTILGLALPASLGKPIAWVAVGLLIVVPVVRVLWLGTRWSTRGDTRFALAAVVLASTVAAGAVIAAVLG